MTNARPYELQVEMVDNQGYYRKANYGSFKIGPGPDYLIEAGNFSSNDNWFVRDAFGKSDSHSFTASDTSTGYESCVNTTDGGAGW